MAQASGAGTSAVADIDTRVLIVGGGLSGMTLAAALGGAGLDTVVVDRDPPEVRVAPGHDLRTTAIALATRRILEGAEIWPGVIDQAEPILDIRIADGRAPVFLHFDHTEVGDEPFGHIVDNRLLRRAMLDRLAALPSVTTLAPAALTQIRHGGARVSATLSDGRTVRAELVVGADGKGSLVRRLAGIRTRGFTYRQKAFVCALGHELPHEGVAVEHFFPAGPFAALPMGDDADGTHRSSIVWSDTPRRAAALAAMPEAAFNAAINARVGSWLGDARVLGARGVYPLGLQFASRLSGDRLALVADAGHAIHPIAGQGLNLGLRDVAALAEVVIDAARLGQDAGSRAVLDSYDRWRRFDILAMMAATDGLVRLFSNAVPPVQLIRDIGLAAVGRIPRAKAFFMHHAMGTQGRLPRMVRGEAL